MAPVTSITVTDVVVLIGIVVLAYQLIRRIKTKVKHK